MQSSVRLWLISGIVVILAVSILFVITRPSPAIQNMVNKTGQMPSVPTGNLTVTIRSFAFSPSSLAVRIGDTVTWINEDATGHTVTSDSGSELASPSFNAGQMYSHTFTKAGSYPYHCAFHPGMKGTIIVS